MLNRKLRRSVIVDDTLLKAVNASGPDCLCSKMRPTPGDDEVNGAAAALLGLYSSTRYTKSLLC